MNIIRLTIVLAAGLIAGCATVPAPLEGDYSEAFYPDQATDQSVGARVRWGGIVVETRPESSRTCIELLARELDSSARPRHSDDDFGRFIACRDEFIDPEIFVNGREVTVAGRLTRFRDGKVGEFNYVYPVVDADSVYLWPEQPDQHWYGHGYYDAGYPYFWPYYRSPFYYGGFGSPFYRPYPRGGYIHRSSDAPQTVDRSKDNVEKQ